MMGSSYVVVMGSSYVVVTGSSYVVVTGSSYVAVMASSYVVVSRRTCKSTHLPSRRWQPLQSVTLTKSTMQVDTPGHQLVSQQ